MQNENVFHHANHKLNMSILYKIEEKNSRQLRLSSSADEIIISPVGLSQLEK